MKSASLILLLLIFLIAGCIEQKNMEPKETPPPTTSTPEPTAIPTLEVQPVIPPIPNPTETTPQSFKVALWDYQVCSYSGIQGSCKPQDYIMSDNVVVKYYASNLYVQETGKPYLLWKEGNPFGKPKGLTFELEYIRDSDLFNGRDDYWQNPDYVLTHDFRGDCEDLSLTLASIYMNKGIKTKLVTGRAVWINPETGEASPQKIDMALELKKDGIYYRYYTGSSLPIMVIRDRLPGGMKSFEPELMFDKNSYYTEYNKDW